MLGKDPDVPATSVGICMDVGSDDAFRLLSVVRSLDWPVSSRPPVMGQGLCCGLRQKRSTPMVETLEGAGVDLIRLITSIVRRLFGVNFTFTSIQVNANTVSQDQRDKNFQDDSILIVVGEFEGGEFVLEEVVLDLKGKALRFDGTRMHSSRPFRGERYSLVCFTHKAWAKASASMIEELEALGFTLGLQNEPHPPAPEMEEGSGQNENDF